MPCASNNFKHDNPGCPDCGPGGPCGQYCPTIYGCSSTVGLDGATVSLVKSGVAVGTCTTDVTGKCCIPIAAAGTDYGVTVTPPAGAKFNSYVNNSLSLTCTTNSPSITLTPQTGYSCSNAVTTCCSTGILYPLTYTLGSSSQNYSQLSGTVNPSTPYALQCIFPDCGFGQGAYQNVTDTIPVLVSLLCNNGAWSSVVRFPDVYCTGILNCAPWVWGFVGDNFVRSGTLGSTCNPQSGTGIQFTVPMSGTCENGILDISGTVPSSTTYPNSPNPACTNVILPGGTLRVKTA